MPDTMALTVTDRAAEKLTHLIAAEAVDGPLRLRVTVSGGGCSGFQYSFNLDAERTSEDQVFEKNGVAVVIDPASLEIITGSEVDYKDDLVGSAFIVRNPNAVASCGCGNSFSL